MSLILLCLAAFRDLQLFEDEIRSMSRETVLRKLEKILQEFSLHEAINQGIEEEQAKNFEIQLKTFGSYRLGCHHPDADIDVYINPCFFGIRSDFIVYRLCLAPRHCTRVNFFEKLPILLEVSSFISDMHIIPNAYAPFLILPILLGPNHSYWNS